MKKLLLSILSLTCLGINAQTLTQANHTPSFWDKPYGMLQCDSLSVAAGSTGAGSVWSFTPTTYPSTLANFVTSLSNNASFLPADAMVAAGANNTSYYTTGSANQLAYYGGVVSVGGNVLTLKYATPAIVAAYPMSLNTATTSITSGTINVTVPLPITAPFNGTCNVITDATGTLSLPGRDFTDIIRKTTNEVLSASGTATITVLKYEFFSPSSNSKAPILSIRSTTLSSGFGTDSQTFAYVLSDYTTVGVKEQKVSKTALLAFPNPATNEINFATTQPEAKKIQLFDVTGKLLVTENIESGKLKINTENLVNGLYFYSAIGNNNQVLTSGKFTVSK